MAHGPELLLIAAVAAVGVLHTMVPDHWVPIMLLARQRGWSRGETARAALQAGTGHVLSTLGIAVIVWLAGVAVAERFGQIVDAASSVALIALGGWIAFGAWRELRGGTGHRHDHGTPIAGAQHDAHDHHHHHHHDDDEDHHHDDDHHHSHAQEHDHHHHAVEPAPAEDPLYAPLRGDTALLTRHAHVHRHDGGAPHLHWHDHLPDTAHAVTAALAAVPPLHRHRHRTTARTALLLILGSSPMVEGVPAFFAAAKYGVPLLAVMAAVFAASTIATYVVLCVGSAAGLDRLHLGPVERYGEVLSGGLIMLIGLVFWIWPVL